MLQRADDPWDEKGPVTSLNKCYQSIKESVELRNTTVIKIKLRARRCNKHTQEGWTVEDNKGGLGSSSLQPTVPSISHIPQPSPNAPFSHMTPANKSIYHPRSSRNTLFHCTDKKKMV